MHPVPRRPWERVGADLFEFDNSHYLLLTDYYSSYFEVDAVRSLTTEATINICKK